MIEHELLVKIIQNAVDLKKVQINGDEHIRYKLLPEDIKPLGDALAKNHVVRELDISHNYLGNHAIIELASLLKNNTAIFKLEVANNRIDDEGICAIAAIPNLKEINVSGNYSISCGQLKFCIKAKGISALSKNSGLLCLNLGSAWLDEEAVSLLLQNKTIIELEYDGDLSNSLSIETKKKLQAHIEENAVQFRLRRKLFIEKLIYIAQGRYQQESLLCLPEPLVRQIITQVGAEFVFDPDFLQQTISCVFASITPSQIGKKRTWCAFFRAENQPDRQIFESEEDKIMAERIRSMLNKDKLNRQSNELALNSY